MGVLASPTHTRGRLLIRPRQRELREARNPPAAASQLTLEMAARPSQRMVAVEHNPDPRRPPVTLQCHRAESERQRAFVSRLRG